MSKKYLIGVFLAIAFTMLLAISSVTSSYKKFMALNPTYRGEITSVGVSSDKIKWSELFEILKKDKNAVASIEHIGVDVSYGQAIYFNDLKGDMKLSEGRFLSKEDFEKSDEKYIVIGKNMKKYITDEEYININGEKFKVIGVLGNKNRGSVYDNTFYINLNGYLSTIQKEEIELYINSSSNEVLEEIKNKYKDVSIYPNVESKNLFFKVMGDAKGSLISFGFMSVLFFLNIINVTSYYAKYKLKEIGIRKSYGGSSWSIFKCIFKEYVQLATIGFLIGLCIYYLLRLVSSLEVFVGTDIGLINIVLVYVCIIFFGTLVSIISFIKTYKYKIYELLKGR